MLGRVRKASWRKREVGRCGGSREEREVGRECKVVVVLEGRRGWTAGWERRRWEFSRERVFRVRRRSW